MKKIEQIGNLTFYAEQNEDGTTTITVVNGTDIVAREVYFGGTVRQAIDHILRIRFDTFHFFEILDGIEAPSSEHNNRLIFGNIPGCQDIEYFKRIDNTDYYKHFTRRPRM